MMATYFQEGSEIQENMQTLYLMNPNYSYINIAAYSDTHNSQPQSNVLLLNALSQGSIPHAPPPPHQPFIAIPRSDNHGRPSTSTDNHDHHHGDPLHGLSVSQGLSLSLSRNPGVSVNGAARGGVVLRSKYFKPAQELLDEVVSVGYQKGGGAHKEKGKEAAAASSEVVAAGGSKVAAVATEQLSPGQRQELQMKKAKLLNMLDQVEQRYRQYHSQMQAVVSSFEHEAGIDSAKSYSSLALKTISRQFRCLKDFICSQIKATNKSLGEDDQPEGGTGSRLRLVDHQLRQQKALEQLGMNMVPNNAWRPQRGLPERAVSVLRAWLFEHFLHPYPKDSDKHMLAKQTGLTRSQVSNWFINARVRLWKPMVEEMYLEEMKAQGQNGENNSDNNNNNNTNNTTPSNNVSPSEKDRSKDHQPISKPTAVAQQQQQHDYRGIRPGLMPGPQTTNDMISSDMVSLIEPTRNAKKQRTDINSSNIRNILSTDMDTKPLDNQTQEGSGGSGFNAVYFANDIPTGRFNQLDHLTRPYGNNGVSLTLGLPRCENLSAHHQQDFLPNQGMQFEKRLEVGAQEADFWGIDIQSHKRFAAHQILHDFVA